MMYFSVLNERLIARLQCSIRNGEMTERGLARRAGISQPHLHNALKGVRSLSPRLADQILRHLSLSLLDLVEPEELPRRAAPAQRLRRPAATSV